MEGVDSDSAIASVTSNPSSFEQMYGDLDKCFFKEPLPNPGPIPPKLSEFGSEEEEPFVQKDICREERQCASELHWGKRNPRSCKPKTYFTKIKRELKEYCLLSKHVHRAAQTLLDIKNGQPNLSSSPKLRGSAKCSGWIEKQKGHLTWQQHTPPATAAFDLKEHFSVSELVTPHGDHNMGQVRFLFRKRLTKSDVHNKRMVLPKKEADIHLAHVRPQIGTTAMIVMKDFDTGQSWEFSYRLWIYKKKIMHILQNTGELTKAHKLQGDLIRFYKNSQGNYVVRGKIQMFVRSGSKHPHVTIRSDTALDLNL